MNLFSFQSLRVAMPVVVLLLAVPAWSQKANPVSCESLAKLEIPDGVITLAQPVAAHTFEIPVVKENGPGGPGAPGGAPAAPRRAPTPYAPTELTNKVDFCRVTATLKPSADSDIKIEVWLPAKDWNGKLLGVGNFGWAGSVMYEGLLLGLEQGYAAVSTDTGHDNSLQMGEFAMGHPDKAIDYGYRSQHEMTLKAKALIKAFYGKPQTHAYWFGCSLGGQQGLTEIQRFPQDYDGAIIGAPAAPIVNLNSAQIMAAVLISQNPARAIPAAKMKLVHQRIMAQCDELDGVKDGILENPEACPFKPQEMACKSGDGDDCLTAPQVELLDQYINGYLLKTGERIHAGTALGGESQNGLNPGAPMSVALNLFRYMIFQDPNWDWTKFDIDRDSAYGNAVLGAVNPTKNANLKPFFDRGGRLMMYHGWNDGQSPRQSFNYYERVLKTVGPETADHMRVFSIPGMGHCMGGQGCDVFDKLTVLDKWVTTGAAPQQFVSSKLDKDGKVIRTHPVCAYPAVGKYKGTGSTDDAANYTCVKP